MENEPLQPQQKTLFGIAGPKQYEDSGPKQYKSGYQTNCLGREGWDDFGLIAHVRMQLWVHRSPR